MSETVYFRADTFRATIYLPKLHELTITNIRKLLRLVFCYDWGGHPDHGALYPERRGG